MGKAIGIDLGTTNSVVAFEGTGGVDVVLNSMNERSTRSVVGMHKGGDLLVGTPAWDNAPRNPQNTILSVKRLMGRFHDDPSVKQVMARYEYKVVKPDDGDDVRVVLGDKRLSPTEVSAAILRKLKEDAERRLGDEVTHAVITVPAYFSMNQRQATRTAGEMAGLRVKNIISEPSAAAMAFGVGLQEGDMKNVLVYDMGGGTFDISVLFITGEMFNELATEGDMWLGGDDFDQAIVNLVISQVEKENGVKLAGNSRLKLQIKKAAERAKISLSETSSAVIYLDSVVPLPGGEMGDVDLEITRAQFEELPISDARVTFAGVPREELERWCADLKINPTWTSTGIEFGPDNLRNRVKKSLLLTRKALREAHLRHDDIHHVLLVGGSTTIPLVQRMLADEFGAARIMRNIDPMECVARGAGIAALRIQSIVCHSQLGRDGSTACLEANPPDAQVCKKCGATLVAEKQCQACGKANDLQAESCACGQPFKRMDAGNVTAKPIGLLAADDRYEVIVPKSTPYPTVEPVIRSFRTARNTTKAVRVPIYHAEIAEFDPKDVNQWQGAADIRLEGVHLPEDTLVDVSIGIDRDGCLDIEAIIQDGSRRRGRIFIDPRIGPNAKPRSVGLEDDEDDVPRAVNRLMWSIASAEIALAEYPDHFEGDGQAKLKSLLVEARQAVEHEDEAECKRLEEAIDKLLKEQFGAFWLLLLAEMRCRYDGLEPATIRRTQGIIHDIRHGMAEGAPTGQVVQSMDRLVDELKSMHEQYESKLDHGALLKRA